MLSLMAMSMYGHVVFWLDLIGEKLGKNKSWDSCFACVLRCCVWWKPVFGRKCIHIEMSMSSGFALVRMGMEPDVQADAAHNLQQVMSPTALTTPVGYCRGDGWCYTCRGWIYGDIVVCGKCRNENHTGCVLVFGNDVVCENCVREARRLHRTRVLGTTGECFCRRRQFGLEVWTEIGPRRWIGNCN